jgi:hypothetical protein
MKPQPGMSEFVSVPGVLGPSAGEFDVMIAAHAQALSAPLSNDVAVRNLKIEGEDCELVGFDSWAGLPCVTAHLTRFPLTWDFNRRPGRFSSSAGMNSTPDILERPAAFWGLRVHKTGLAPLSVSVPCSFVADLGFPLGSFFSRTPALFLPSAGMISTPAFSSAC